MLRATQTENSLWEQNVSFLHLQRDLLNARRYEKSEHITKKFRMLLSEYIIFSSQTQELQVNLTV
jgi:hypothetical protein